MIMRRYSVIVAAVLLSVLFTSCREKAHKGRPTIGLVENILAEKVSEESLILKNIEARNVSGTIAVVGPSNLSYPLAMRFAGCDDFDNVDGRRISDQLPDFAGETIDMVLDEANFDYHSFVASGDTDSLRAVTVRNLLAVLDNKCYSSVYDLDNTLQKKSSKAVLFPSPYMSAYGAFDVDTLLRSRGIKLPVIFPARKAFRTLLEKEGEELCVAVLTDSIIASDLIHKKIFEEVSKEMGISGAECKVFHSDTIDSVLDNVLRIYSQAGGSRCINAILVDDIHVYSSELRASLEELAVARDAESIAMRKLIAADCRVIDTSELSTEECYKALRNNNLFTHEVAYPRVNGFVTAASPDGKAFKLVETRVNVSDKH